MTTASDEHPRFTLGLTVITAAAKQTLDAADVQAALTRHARGDWGELDPSDQAENERPS